MKPEPENGSKEGRQTAVVKGVSNLPSQKARAPAAANWDGAQNKRTVLAAVALPSKTVFWHAGLWPLARSLVN
eukprot:6192969-Pleurochrysis_carterae.AAC.1